MKAILGLLGSAGRKWTEARSAPWHLDARTKAQSRQDDRHFLSFLRDI
jgi:hypothetical protein